MPKKKEYKNKEEKELITADNIVLDGEFPDRITVNKVDYTDLKKTQSKWIIDVTGLSDSQFEEAFKMLESGMKPRKVAFYFGFHRSKIRARQ